MQHATSLYKTEMHTKVFGNLLCLFPKAVAMNMQFSDAAYCVAVERTAPSVFINFKV